MGSTINPRARGGGSLREELNASRADRQQIRRLTSTPPKPRPASGGSMQGFTRATPGGTMWGGGQVIPRDWTFDTAVDSSPGAKPGLILGEDGVHFGASEPGYYTTMHRMQFTIGSGSATSVLIQGNDMSMDQSAYGEAWAHQYFDGRFRAVFWCGPFWLDGVSTPLNVQAGVIGSFTAGTVLSTWVDVHRVG